MDTYIFGRMFLTMCACTTVFASVLFPFASHLTREAFACADVDIPPYTFTGFMITYSISMLIHSHRMQRSGPCPGEVLVATVLFLTTGVVCGWSVMRVDPHWFVLPWSVHAIPSAFFWPHAFQCIATVTKRRTHLALWSLQGTVGDLVGCICASLFEGRRDAWSDTIASATAVLLVTMAIVDARVRHEGAPPSSSRVASLDRRMELVCTMISLACLKIITYCATNWMAELNLKIHTYNVASVVGTVLSGAIADCDRRIMLVSTTVAGGVLAAGTIGAYMDPRWWSEQVFSFVFGVLTSFVDTVFSICICADLATAKRSFGATTAVLDGGGTLIASMLQLVATRAFGEVQMIACIVLSGSIVCHLVVVHGPRELESIMSEGGGLREPVIRVVDVDEGRRIQPFV